MRSYEGDLCESGLTGDVETVGDELETGSCLQDLVDTEILDPVEGGGVRNEVKSFFSSFFTSDSSFVLLIFRQDFSSFKFFIVSLAALRFLFRSCLSFL